MSPSDAPHPAPTDPAIPLELAGLPLDAFPHGLTVADAQGRILQTNAAAIRLLGLSAAEQLTRSLQSPEWRLIHPDGSPLAVADLPAVRALREQARIEAPEVGVFRPDGDLVWLNIVAVPLGPDRVLVTYGDVSESRRIKEALRESEGQNQALIKAIPDLVFTNRRDGEYLAFHAGSASGLLVPPEAFLHRTVQEVLPQPLASTFLGLFEEVLDAQAMRELEYTLPIDGDVRHFEARVVPCTEDTVITIVRDCTERKLAETTLQSSEALYRELLERQGEGFGMVDAQERFLVANPVAEAIFGVAPGKLVGRCLLDFLPPDQQDLVRGESRLREQGTHSTYELGIQWEDGTPRMLQVTATPRPRPEGEALQVIGVFRDITARKLAEEALEHSRAELKAIYDHAPVMICVTDEQRRVLYVNPAFAAFTGRAQGDLVRPGDGYGEVLGCIHADTLPEGCGSGECCQTCPLRTALEDTARTGQMHDNIEYHTELLRDGEPSSVALLASTARFQANGQKHLLLCLNDISERKRAEQALQASEERYRAQFNLGSEGIFTVSLDGKILDANDAVARMHGYTRAEMLALDLRDLDSPESSRLMPERMRRLQAGESLNFELEHHHKDGHTFPIEVSASLVTTGGTPFILAFQRDITERKQAEAALQDSQRRLQRAEGVAHFGNWELDLGSGVMRASSGASAIYGIDGEEWPLALVQKLTLPEYRPLMDAALASLIEQQTPYSVEFRIRRPSDGQLVDIHSMAEYDSRRRIVFGVIHDLTERKRSEAEVRASKQQYDDLVTSIPVGIYVIRSKPDGAIAFEFVSPRMARLLGMERDQLLANIQAAFEAVHPEDSEAFVQLNLEGLRLTVPFDWTGRFLVGGTVRWLHIESTPRILADGDVLWHGVVTDVTERRRVEDELQRSEANLSALVESTTDLIWSVDLEYRLLAYNATLAEHFQRNYGTRAFVGAATWDLLPPDRAPLWAPLYDRALTEGSFHIEYELTDARLLDVVLNPILKHGQPVGISVFAKDITERRRADKERSQLQAQLNQAQKMESLGSLAGGVAHDMNNVLGAILGLATAHVEAQAPGSPAHHAFETIIKAAERGGTMLRSLLSFARHGTADMRDLDLNTIIREEVHLLERTTLAKIRLVMDLAPDLRSMHGDASALTHVFMNLCVNAVDAMSESGTLTLRTRNRDAHWIDVQVEDTGVGMTKETLEKAMDPFFTTKEVGKGTGLGLSIVYSTVKAHQGTIEIRSQPEQGSCVTMSFPVSGPSPGDPLASGKHATITSRKALDILLVDDDELIQSSMQAILEVLKHHVNVASSGEEALAKLQAGLVPDLIILDMNMPGMGGAGALPRLRALLPTVPILLATGRADQTALDLVEADPHVTLLAKPFGMKELQKLLEPILP